MSDDLAGLEEYDRGLYLDTSENRRAIRRAKRQYRRVYLPVSMLPGWREAHGGEGDESETVTLLTLVDSEIENARLGDTYRPALRDPRDLDSDYLTGQDLLDDLDACDASPAWVIGQTKTVLEMAARGETHKRGLPVRCKFIKRDGHRCYAWSPMRDMAKGYCQVHATKTQQDASYRHAQDEAVRILLQAAPAAAAELEALALEAASEPVRLKASTEILDRVGVRGGSELSIEAKVETVDPTAEVRERLTALARRLAVEAANTLAPPETAPEIAVEIVSE